MGVAVDILDWAKAQIETLALVASVKRRKRIARSKGDPDPVCVIAMEQPEGFIRRSTGGYVTLSFTLDVALYYAKSPEYADPDWILNARASLRSVLLVVQPFEGICHAAFDPVPVLSPVAFVEGFDISPMRFVYHGAELIGV